MTSVMEAVAFLAAVAVPVLLGLRLLSPLGKKPGPIGEAELLRSGVHFGYRVWQDRVRQGRLTPVRRKAAWNPGTDSERRSSQKARDLDVVRTS